MSSLSGPTDKPTQGKVCSELRAYFDDLVARPGSQIYLRVESRWVKDGTPVILRILLRSHEGDHPDRELDCIGGALSDNQFEHRHQVDLPQADLDRADHLVLVFEAQVLTYHLWALSQYLHIHRPGFSA